MSDPASALRETFVVEVGVRQAWPFITFAPAGGGYPEIRLYVDSAFTENGKLYFADGDPDAALVGLLNVADLTVDHADVAADGALTVRFSDARVLTISGEGTEHTTHEVWWLASWPPA